MKCPACNSTGPFEDGFCARCGLEQPASRLPVRREKESLPAVWREAAPLVARGLALVAAGLAAEWLLRNGARRAVAGTIPARRKETAIIRRNTELVEEILAVSHTVIRRRVVVKR